MPIVNPPRMHMNCESLIVNSGGKEDSHLILSGCVWNVNCESSPPSIDTKVVDKGVSWSETRFIIQNISYDSLKCQWCCNSLINQVERTSNHFGPLIFHLPVMRTMIPPGGMQCPFPCHPTSSLGEKNVYFQFLVVNTECQMEPK